MKMSAKLTNCVPLITGKLNVNHFLSKHGSFSHVGRRRSGLIKTDIQDTFRHRREPKLHIYIYRTLVKARDLINRESVYEERYFS